MTRQLILYTLMMIIAITIIMWRLKTSGNDLESAKSIIQLQDANDLKLNIQDEIEVQWLNNEICKLRAKKTLKLACIKAREARIGTTNEVKCPSLTEVKYDPDQDTCMIAWWSKPIVK